MHPQGQGHQEIHHPQHGRVCCYSYVKNTKAVTAAAATPAQSTPSTAMASHPVAQFANQCLQQVTSLTPRSSPSTPSPRCTSSCSTASLVPFTARSFGTFVLDGGQLCLAWCHGGPMGKLCACQTQAAEKNLGGKRTPSSPPPSDLGTSMLTETPIVSVLVRVVATVLLPHVSDTTRTARRLLLPRAPRLRRRSLSRPLEAGS